MEGKPADLQEKVIKALGEKGVSLPCPRCNNRKFSVLDGFFANRRTNRRGISYVPTAVVICDHCGFLSQYALGALNISVANREEDM